MTEWSELSPAEYDAREVAEREVLNARLWRERHDAWVTVRCPYCHAEPGQPCMSARGRRLTTRETHVGRIEAAYRRRVGLPER